MGFFSNIIKKVGKFVANIFRDVEKPVKKVEDVGLKAFREFQEFIEAPIEKIEGIDDLRLIENNIDIKVVKTSKITETVDNKKDLKKVISMMKDDKLLKSYKKKYTQID